MTLTVGKGIVWKIFYDLKKALPWLQLVPSYPGVHPERQLPSTGLQVSWISRQLHAETVKLDFFYMWWICACGVTDGSAHGPLARYVKLRVVHAPGMPGTFAPPPRVSDPDMHHGTCVTHVPWCMSGSLISGFLWSRWRGKRPWHSWRMRNPQSYVSGRMPMITGWTITMTYKDSYDIQRCHWIHIIFHAVTLCIMYVGPLFGNLV